MTRRPSSSIYKQTWTNWCLARIRYAEAWFKWCCVPKIPILHESKQDLFILPSYRYNEQVYSIPIRVDKSKTMTFVRACVIQPTLDGKEEEGVDLTDRITQLLGPNQDFHGLAMTPLLAGYPSIRLYFLDVETLDTVHRTFHQHEPMSLTRSSGESCTYQPPPLQRLSLSTSSKEGLAERHIN